MKAAIVSFWLVALALAWGAGEAAGAPRPIEAVRIGGREYVRLADWAKAYGFDLCWVKRDETLQLSNHAAKLLLGVDSREAQVNGVQVWLLFPTAQRNGAVYISQLDLQKNLQPVLSPPRNRSGAAIRTICLDPGHGGKDPGNQVGANQEKKYTLLLAREVRDQLQQAGLKAALTRSTDTLIELPARPEVAKRRNADLFVSLHFNSIEASRGSVQGAEVYCLTPAGASSTNARGEGGGGESCAGNRCDDKNMFLAYQVQKALARNLTVEDRGVRRARFAVLRDAVMPAVLIEAGFMSHPVEGRKIFTAAYRREMARAIVDGLLAYKRGVEQGDNG
jgi:N-acetylmuramoyl-L-alanine amidase